MTSDFKIRSIDTNLKACSSSLKIARYPSRYEGVQNCHILQGPHQISQGSVATTKPGGGWRFEVRCIYLQSPRFHVCHVMCLIVGNGEIHQSAHENFHGEDHEVFPQNLQCSRTPRHFKNASKSNRLISLGLGANGKQMISVVSTFINFQFSVLSQHIRTYPNISFIHSHPFRERFLGLPTWKSPEERQRSMAISRPNKPIKELRFEATTKRHAVVPSCGMTSFWHQKTHFWKRNL